ncbi:MBG domain-containing protein [Flavobacterium laiguense]|uniref:LamG-like jellyroll fold domain-containing protein n=1 Tax=Flavobacterium laiguense TaxID=2169409 RepID=A0A2U1JY11_9FLAO|nr:MBG domain-containing protein [Flavobacterium laiguense]PWA10106.1 hypothetical protein DB891_05245 [Flavobacterium laiguense]
MKKKITLLLSLLITNLGIAQTTFFFENFETPSTTFSLNTSDLGGATSGQNSWIKNNNYNGGSGSLICMGFPFSYTINNVAPQNAQIINSPNSTYMHIISSKALSDGILCASYIEDDNFCYLSESNFLKMNTGVTTTGFTNISINFWWLCGGDTSSGELYYSINGGNTWILSSSNYNNQLAWSLASVTNPAWDNQSDLRFAFRFVNNLSNTTNLGFSIDDVKISTTMVTPLPTAYIVTGGGAYCAGGSGMPVYLSNSETGVTYQLKNGATNVGSPVSGTGAAISFGNQTTAGTYKVEATRTVGGSTATMTGNPVVTVTPLPATPTITAGGPTTFCTGGSVTLTSSSATGNVWSTSATTQSIVVTAGTTYTVAVNSGGCASASSEGTIVTVNTIPVAPAVTTPITYNQGATATPLTATGSNLLWYQAATGGSGTATVATPSTATEGNVYVYWVSQTVNGCEGSRAKINVIIAEAATPATHLNFDGVNDYVNCGNSPTLNLTGSITVESMIYINSLVNNRCIVGKDNWSANTGYSFWLSPDNKFGLRFGNRSFLSNTVVPRNEYVHLSATYNLSTKTVSIFLNGVLDRTYSNVSNPVSNSGNLYLGTPQDAVGSSSYAFNGSIDEVRIWNRALSQAEIVNNMNCELPTPTTQTGLLAYYQFNQGVGATDNAGATSLTDASANANHGTLNNFALTGAASNWVAGSPIVTGTNCPYIVPTITVTDINKTYGDVNFDLEATSNSQGVITYSIEGVNTTGTTLSGINNKTVNVGNAGSLTIRATQAADGIYASETKDITVTIGKATLTVTADTKSKVYGNADPELTYQVTLGVLKSGDVFTGSLSRNAGENVANYAISAGTVSAGANYNVSFVPANLSITPKAITITADTKSKVYGDADPALTYQVTLGVLKSGDVFTGSLSRTAGENVADYAISAGTVSAGANYNVSFVPANLSITPKAITITADTKSKVYGNADPALTYQVTLGVLKSGDVFTGSLSRSAGENVANYAISAGTVSAGANYNVSFVPANLSITPKAITITADTKSKVYGDADPALTYQVTLGVLKSGDVFTGSLSRTAGENVANYAISAGTVSAGANYTMTFLPSNLSITARAIMITADAKSKVYGGVDPVLTYQAVLVGADVLTGSLTRAAGENVGVYAISSTLTNDNYDVTFVPADLTIIKKAVTVTADAKSKVYGGVDPVLTYQAVLLGTDVLTGSLTRAAGENVGVYAISSTLTNDNYDITFVPADVTIIKVAVTVTADAKSKVYGGVDPALTYQAVLLGTDVFTGSLTRTAGENAGVYTISSTLTNDNYDITFVPADLTIIKKAVTVTADAKSKVYGDVDPALTYTVSPSLLSGGSFTGILTRAVGENVGTYAIGQGNLSAGSNYTISYNDASFVITKADQVITWNQILESGCDGGTSTALTASTTSGLPLSFASSNTNVASVSNGVLAYNNYGAATITVSQLGDINYNAAQLIVLPVLYTQPNLIRKHFDDVIFFDNSSKIFKSFSWYKDGMLVSGQTAQYFKDNGVLNGTYYAMATKVDGTVVTTCPLTFSPSVEVEYLKIAPNPVSSNSIYQLITNVDPAKLQNARVTVFNVLGALITDKVIGEKTVDMIAPSAEGIYIVKLTLASGKYFTKNLLVKN